METRCDGSGGVLLKDQTGAEILSPTRCVSALVRFFKLARSSDYRYLASAGVLCIAILIAPALTVRNLSVHTNGYMASLQWAFVVLMAPEVLRDARASLANSFAFRTLGIGFLVCMMGWIAQGVRLDEIDRTSFYVVQPFFVLAASAWFRSAGDAGLQTIYWAKLVATACAVSYLFLTLWLAAVPDMDWRQVGKLPIYRNIRHLGYDLAVVASLGVMFWPLQKCSNRTFGWILFGLLGYVSVWSAGRGQILAFFAFIGVFCALLPDWSRRRYLLPPCVAFSAGGALFCVLNPDLAVWIIGKSSAGSADEITSGRLNIWIDTIQKFAKADWLGIFVGLGPDAFVRHSIAPWLVQPHNFVIQILLEFGIVGLAAVALSALDFIRRSMSLLRSSAPSALSTGAIAAIAALILYGMVDGIFYHASPFMASMLLVAFVLSEGTRVDRLIMAGASARAVHS